MKAFCPQCGSDNEAQPGQRVTCAACTSTFTAPGSIATALPVAPAPPAPLPPLAPAPVVVTPGAASPSAPVSPLAIASLITALLCCGPVGVVLGVLALQQIDASHAALRGRELAIAGIVIGVISSCSGLGIGLLSLLGH